MTTLLIATRNAHKTQEIGQILTGNFQFLTLADFVGAPIVAEDAPTFAGNAEKKVMSLAKWLAENPSLALKKIQKPEAPFLCVGRRFRPRSGCCSTARPACIRRDLPQSIVQGAGNAPDPANNAKLLRLLEGVPAEKRTARFRCVIALTRLLFSYHDAASVAVVSSTRRFAFSMEFGEGHIGFKSAGKGGFGYDPLFYSQRTQPIVCRIGGGCEK